ncbi:helix-turn-helix transcriptional regulator [uncultured Massilia sp.]|uniref:helix-turn-helix transcriptional regulator n=1 Tax=uncultured Massilia sp. TaxID=169973 RepID=UPI0035A38E3A
MSEQQAAGQLWRRPMVEIQTGLSRAEIYRRMQLGTFPKPVKIGVRIVAWESLSVQAWMKSLPSQG